MANSNTSVITKQRRINLAKITRGAVATIPKITHIAFGDGAGGRKRRFRGSENLPQQGQG